VALFPFYSPLSYGMGSLAFLSFCSSELEALWFAWTALMVMVMVMCIFLRLSFFTHMQSERLYRFMGWFLIAFRFLPLLFYALLCYLIGWLGGLDGLRVVCWNSVLWIWS